MRRDSLTGSHINLFVGRLVLANPDPNIRGYAEFLFENDYAPYMAKRWGVFSEEIDLDVFKRVPFRLSYGKSYFTAKYEAIL